MAYYLGAGSDLQHGQVGRNFQGIDSPQDERQNSLTEVRCVGWNGGRRYRNCYCKRDTTEEGILVLMDLLHVLLVIVQ